MYIPRLLTIFIGKEFLERNLREIEIEHASARARIHSNALNNACRLYPNEDRDKLSRIIDSAETEMLAPFEEEYNKLRRELLSAIAACD
jgi:hypothetical protein